MKKKIINILLICLGIVAALLAVPVTGRAFDAYNLPFFNSLGLIHGSSLALYPLYTAAFYYLFRALIHLIQYILLKKERCGSGANCFSKCAVISLFLSSFGFIIPFLGAGGIIAGHYARKTCKKIPGTGGAGLAAAGIALGYSTFLMYAFAVMAVFYISR